MNGGSGLVAEVLFPAPIRLIRRLGALPRFGAEQCGLDPLTGVFVTCTAGWRKLVEGPKPHAGIGVALLAARVRKLGLGSDRELLAGCGVTLMALIVEDNQSAQRVIQGLDGLAGLRVLIGAQAP